MAVNWQQPTHSDKIKVINQPGDFTSYAVSAGNFAPGTVLARLTAPTLTISPRAYSSVQIGSKQNDNIELNCDFLFVNHSCEPSLEFHVLNADSLSSAKSESEHNITIEVRVAKRFDDRGNEIGLKEGEPVTFFYPSTEWDMAQPFTCLCKTDKCMGMIRGAKYVDKVDLKDYFVNQHIEKLKETQENHELDDGGSASASVGGTTTGSSNM